MPETPLILNVFFFIIGLSIIIKGSDLFLDNAVWIARVSGVPQIVIGATIVSLCTTLPELVSSATASFKGATDMALGNAVGSVICNTGLIMGIMLLFIVARIRREVFLIKGIFMIGAIAIALLLIIPLPLSDGRYVIQRTEGGVLLVFMLIFLVVNYYESLHSGPLPASSVPVEKAALEVSKVTKHDWLTRMSFFFAGGVMVGIGAYLLIEFGQRLARDIGISEAVISLVFVAFGTSLPELFTAISAVRKKAEEISVGNIFGANVLNLAWVIGTASIIRPVDVQDNLLAKFDIPVALAICSIAFISGLVRGKIGRRTGILLLTIYVLYLISLFAMHRIN